jgi:transposase-like protein
VFGSRRRPDRKTLAGLVRETGGNVTALAAALGVSRPTAYSWVYAHGLERLVGIRTLEEGDTMPKPPPTRPARPEPAWVNVTLRLAPQTWKRVRIAAIDDERSSSELVEEAVQAWLATRERPS